MLFLDAGLGTSVDESVVLFGLLSDGEHQLGLALFGRGKLLDQGLLDFFFLCSFLRRPSFSDHQNSLVEIASTFLPFSESLLALGLGGLLPLAETLDDALALGTLLRVLALLSHAYSVGIVAELFELIGHGLGFTLVRTHELVVDHLQSKLVALQLALLL